VTNLHDIVSVWDAHNNVQGHRNANVSKQTYDGSCKLSTEACWFQQLPWQRKV